MTPQFAFSQGYSQGYAAGRASRDAEVEALRADAERYRWLLNFGKQELWYLCADTNSYDGVEAEIDAAMRKEK